MLDSQTQTVEKVLSDSLALECSLEDEMAKNMQHVLIMDSEDAYKILHNVWVDSGKDATALAARINKAKSWCNHTEPMFDAFNGTDLNGKALKHAFVNGTRINMNGKIPA